MLTHIRHKLASTLLHKDLIIEDWEPEETPYPITIKGGILTVTDQGEQTYYPDSTAVIQEHPQGPSYTATIAQDGEIIGWHHNPDSITIE